MSILKKALSICLILVAVVGLFGCSMMQQAVDSSDPASDQLLTAFLDSLCANDADAAFELMLPGHMERADFDTHWAILLDDWGKHPDYSYQKIRVNISLSTDGKKVDNVYIVSRESEPDYIVSLSRAETGGQAGITYISIEILLATFGGTAY